MLVTIFLLPDLFSSWAQWQFRERFWQLAERIETLRHPNLLPLYGYGERNGLCYLLSPELSGEPLFASYPDQRGCSPQEALDVLIPLASALNALHQHGLTSQFFHPSALLRLEGHNDMAQGLQITNCGLMDMVRCLDAEKKEEQPSLSAYHHLQDIAGHYLGSPHYLAPEIVQGGAGDARSTVYILGILLFTLLSGRPPFTGQDYLEIARQQVIAPLPSLHALVPDLPIALEVVINQALSRDPMLRFSHPHALVEAYTRVLQERIQRPQHHSTFQILQRVQAIGQPDTERVRSLSEPTSEPLPAITASLWRVQTVPIRAVTPTTTDPLLQQVPSPPLEGTKNVLPPGKREMLTEKQETISSMVRTLQLQRERLQDLARTFAQESVSEKQEAAPPERFPGWLT